MYVHTYAHAYLTKNVDIELPRDDHTWRFIGHSNFLWLGYSYLYKVIISGTVSSVIGEVRSYK